MNQFTNEVLIELLRDENQEAFKELYDRYWLKLYSIAYKKIKAKENAKELVQDLFLSLWSRRKEIVLYSTVDNYLMSALKKSIITYIQTNSNQSAHLVSYHQQQQHEDNTTESSLILNELLQLIDDHVTVLPAHCQKIFILSRFQHLSHKEIADHLNISTKTVANQINKALRLLKLPLKEYSNFFLLAGLIHLATWMSSLVLYNPLP